MNTHSTLTLLMLSAFFSVGYPRVVNAESIKQFLLEPEAGSSREFVINVSSSRRSVSNGDPEPFPGSSDPFFAMAGQTNSSSFRFSLSGEITASTVAKKTISFTLSGGEMDIVSVDLTLGTMTVQQAATNLPVGSSAIVVSDDGKIQEIGTNLEEHDVLGAFSLFVLPSLFVPRDSGKKIRTKDVNRVKEVYYNLELEYEELSEDEYEIVGLRSWENPTLSSADEPIGAFEQKLWAVCEQSSGYVKTVIWEFTWDVTVKGVRAERTERVTVNLPLAASFPARITQKFDAIENRLD